MNAKMKLNHDSTYIIESDNNNKHIVFNQIEIKGKHKVRLLKMKAQIAPRSTLQYELDMQKDSVPTLHSDM